jgi:hypothetical protein
MKKLLLDPRVIGCTAALALSLVAAPSVPAHAARATAAQKKSAAAQPSLSPSDTVREFYKLMRERRFREAFMLSIYAPAVSGLSAAEYDDLRPDFEQRALDAPAAVELTGEQISGNDATVFMKLGGEKDPRDMKIIPIFLVRDKQGPWLIGDRDSQKIVEKSGKKFFFEARIEAHHDVVEDMLKRISTAQLVHASQNGGAYGDLQALTRAGLVPADILSTESTGYRFRVAPAPGGKGWTAGAEPARYGHTGRLSFHIDQSGSLRKEDKGGKPVKGS